MGTAHGNDRPCPDGRFTCCGYPWIMEGYLNPVCKPFSFLPNHRLCFLFPFCHALSENINVYQANCPLGDLQSLWGRGTGRRFPWWRAASGHSSAVFYLSLPCDRNEALVRFLIVRGRCFPTSSKGLRAECRWVSSPSCHCHLGITMAIILPETKIKGRTGWTESMAPNSYFER